MEEFVKICEEIKRERAKAEKATNGDAFQRYDIATDALADILAAYRRGEATEAERDSAREEKRAALEAYKREQETATRCHLRAEILKDNAKQAFFNDYIGKICEIWNAYEGKPHGEKTAAKIRDELRAATGQYISIFNKWDQLNISVCTAPGVPVDNFEIGTAGGAGSPKQRATDENNKILAINADALRVYYCAPYVDDINAHIKKLYKAHEAAAAAYEKAREAFAAYNELTRGNIERADIYHGIKKYLIAR